MLANNYRAGHKLMFVCALLLLLLLPPPPGPAHPFQKDGVAAGLKNHRAGHVEDTHLQSYAFDEQYNTYHSMGYAAAPGSQSLVGKTDAAEVRAAVVMCCVGWQ
jgi:pre-mRNA-processing factor 17